MIIVQSENSLRYTTTTHTHTRKEDFISLLPKVKIYPKYRIFDRFFMSVFDNNCYHLGKSAEWSDMWPPVGRPVRLKCAAFVKVLPCHPQSHRRTLTMCTMCDLAVSYCEIKSIFREIIRSMVLWIASGITVRCCTLSCTSPHSQAAPLDNIIGPHCYHLVPHRVKAELLRFTSH